MATNKPTVNVGDVFVCTEGMAATVVAYRNNATVEIRFSDGTLTTTRAAQLKSGKFVNPNIRNNCGVGFIGQGGFTPTNNQRSYLAWSAMIARCYSEKVLLKHPSYRGCSVEDKWHNYQVFAEWYASRFEGKGTEWELDKDVLCKGNRMYCEELCVALPQELNCLLTSAKSARSYYIGVTMVQGLAPRYMAKCSTLAGSVYLGLYSTPETAFVVYKEFKEDYIKQLANKWQSQIDPRAYEALMNYEVLITD